MSQPSNTHPALRLDACRGASGEGCPRLLARDPGLLDSLRQAATEAGFDAFLLDLCRGRIAHHQGFSLAVSGCANGCSRPHIADLGLIPAVRPALDPGACDRCGACAAACAEAAITMTDDGPVIDPSLCLSCGDCLAACPTGALHAGASGYRVLIGGKLGRRPQLAVELPGLFHAATLPGLLRACLAKRMAVPKPSVRLAGLIDDEFLASLERNHP